MNAQLLLPNPLMPEAVRMVHLVETASSGPFQAFRGLLWAGLGLLVIFMMRGRWWEKGLARPRGRWKLAGSIS